MSIDAAGTIAIGDLTLPRIGYGTMRLTGPRIFGPPPDRAEAVRVLRRAVALGVRVIDTAWYYGPDVADEILAEALHPYDGLTIVTKLGGARRDDGSWYSALTAAELRAGCERDLRLLRVDCLPVVHLRWMPGSGATFAEALQTFLELREEGKIQRIGLSNVSAEQLDSALLETPVATVSNAFSVVDQTDEELVRRCEAAGVAYLPFFPLGASPTARGAKAAEREAVTRVAERHGATAVQVAIAWLLHHSPALLPIPGTSTVAHVQENIAAADLVLTPEDLATLAGE
jgi:aryl-alcohol dehydrogenase-like predicted oxidoreductase